MYTLVLVVYLYNMPTCVLSVLNRNKDPCSGVHPSNPTTLQDCILQTKSTYEAMANKDNIRLLQFHGFHIKLFKFGANGQQIGSFGQVFLVQGNNGGIVRTTKDRIWAGLLTMVLVAVSVSVAVFVKYNKGINSSRFK
jgi:hypothetical protein